MHIKHDEDGYELWLRYAPIQNTDYLNACQKLCQQITVIGSSPTLDIIRSELQQAITSMTGQPVTIAEEFSDKTTVVISTLEHLPPDVTLSDRINGLSNNEGFLIERTSQCLVITAQSDIGLLYGMFHFLRHLQTQKPITDLDTVSAPKIKLRMINHWDNLDRTIERGYAGFSLWDWHKLPHYLSPRYRDYARAMASIGINAVSLTNVNANALILTDQYLHKVASLAEAFRPYGIQVFLTARFSAPIEIGGLSTADPLDDSVRLWWQEKADHIYSIIPDFGGFVVKANSEGQPGPHDYNRTHADGANMLAEALEAHQGLVIWRAFVYDHKTDVDRAKQANLQLEPLDGTFHGNVLLQVKNGAIDFQPREPFHPLFGAMPHTPLMMEFQLTQEYLGCATHLVYLAPLFKETLDADTYCNGEGSTVARVVSGEIDDHRISGMAAVANIGDERNWCGHPFAAANWYAYGRLAWDYTLSSETIADEWLRMTFSNDSAFVEACKTIMIESREAVVDYMMPLGLHHLFQVNHHYGPAPWFAEGRADWTSVYYHQADEDGIGFDRTKSGSDAISQYHAPLSDQLENIDTCPEKFLLWFHHVGWHHIMASGRNLWEELCYRYNHGVETVRRMQSVWDQQQGKIDDARFKHVQDLLKIQEAEARWWRDACLLYFQTFSRQAIPSAYEQPEHTLEHYMNIRHYFVPGIPERRF